MVQRIIAMTRNKRLEAGLGVDAIPGCAASDRTPSLAKRIELSLYSRAASFNEYREPNTLRRRLQSLVSLSFHEAAMERCATKSLGKRELKATLFGVSRLMIKRPLNASPMRVPPSATIVASHNHHRQQSHHHHHHRSQLVCSASVAATQTFFITNEDVLRQIFAYLPGVDTMRSFAVTDLQHACCR
ncbi:hypothetical protein Gpo141_00011018, partial [Globisporangium polare]